MEFTAVTEPEIQGDHTKGQAVRTISNPSQIRLQVTGPEEEVLHFQGPPVGKKWTVTLNVFIQETDE